MQSLLDFSTSISVGMTSLFSSSMGFDNWRNHDSQKDTGNSPDHEKDSVTLEAARGGLAAQLIRLVFDGLTTIALNLRFLVFHLINY